MTGRFIVLDGIDGCGKSTQIRHLAQWLPASGLMPPTAQLICTREPGGTPLGQSIRELLLHTEADQVPSVTAELLLYAADRAQHVDTVIRPALLRGDWVLSDRFAGSTLAYQGYGRGLDRQLITRLESIATTGLEPDLTAWLMVPVEVSLQRRHGEKEDRIEAEGRAFCVASLMVLLSLPSNAIGLKLMHNSPYRNSARCWNKPCGRPCSE